MSQALGVQRSLEVIAKIEDSGRPARSDILASLSPATQLSEEFTKGAQLGSVFRELLQRCWRWKDTSSWVNQGVTLLEQIARKDWEAGGYTSEDNWIRTARPAGSATETRNLVSFWRYTAPLIEKAGYDVPTIVNQLSRGSVAELIAIGNKPGVDARMFKVICQWVLEDRLNDVLQLREFKKNTALLGAGATMDALEAAGLDPVETYRSLSEGEADVTAKLGPIAHMVSSSGIASEALPEFISQMSVLPSEKIRDFCLSTVRDEPVVEPESSFSVIEAGSTTYARLDVTGKELPDGYYEILISKDQIREIWSATRLRLYVNGQEVDLGG